MVGQHWRFGTILTFSNKEGIRIKVRISMSRAGCLQTLAAFGRQNQESIDFAQPVRKLLILTIWRPGHVHGQNLKRGQTREWWFHDMIRRLGPSIGELVGSLGQLSFRLLDVSGRRVQTFVAEELGQADQIAGIVLQILVGHRVAKQMRVELEAADRRVFVAQGPKATVGQRSPFADEHLGRFNGWSGFEISRKGLPSRQRQRTRPLLVALPIPECHRAASFADHQVMEVQLHEIADPTAGVQHDGEDRRRPDIGSEFDLTQEPPHLASVQSFGGQGRPSSVP